MERKVGAESGWGRGAGCWVAVGFIGPISNVVVGEHANKAGTAGNISLGKLPWQIGPWDAGNPNIWTLPAQQPPRLKWQAGLEGGSADQAATGPILRTRRGEERLRPSGGVSAHRRISVERSGRLSCRGTQARPGIFWRAGSIAGSRKGERSSCLAGSWSPGQHKDKTDPKSQNTSPKKVHNTRRARTKVTWDAPWPARSDSTRCHVGSMAIAAGYGSAIRHRGPILQVNEVSLRRSWLRQPWGRPIHRRRAQAQAQAQAPAWLQGSFFLNRSAEPTLAGGRAGAACENWLMRLEIGCAGLQPNHQRPRRHQQPGSVQFARLGPLAAACHWPAHGSACLVRLVSVPTTQAPHGDGDRDVEKVDEVDSAQNCLRSN